MTRTGGVLAAMKAVPGGARHTPAPQSGGMGAINQVAANAMWGNAYQSSYGPFLPRPSRTFTDGAFGPMSPIQPVPVDEPAVPGGFPDPRLWQYRTGWNLPTQPGTEGLKLASFQQLQTIAERYSVARRCIELRKEEICGLEWQIEMTTHAAKAYQNDHKAMRDFGERAAKATKFFRHPDPDYWDFGSFLKALLEEILVFDALSLVFRPKYGKGLGRGLLGSDLDSLSLVSGPTIRPLLGMLGQKPHPPAPAYQQFLYGVPRSDYQTVISGTDIDDYGLAGSEVNAFRADTMLYLPLVPRRETPYGFPPIEQALLPIISGLQKQEYQLGWYQEGTVPACYISPGDPNMTPTQVKELQDALNGIAGDPMYHLKVIVLPPGSKVEPQRPVDLADTFDTLVQTQVCMQLDVMPDELGLLPNVGSAGAGGASNASALRFASGESRDPKSRKSTKPLLMTLAGIANYVIQDICGQQDMQFNFEGLVDEEDKQAITSLGVEQVQNGIASIDEVRDRLDMPPWGLQETSEPVVFTAQGPIPFSMAPQLIANMQGGAQSGQGTNSGQRTPSSRSRTSQPSVRRGGQTRPNGSHPAPVAPHRENPTPAHSAAAGAIQSPTPRTGGTTSRSSVAGSRKKAVEAELGALARHLRKGRDIATWEPRHIPGVVMATISEDIGKGILIDVAVETAGEICLKAAGDWQDEGEPYRESLGIDGTAGDAQDAPHPFSAASHGDYCAGCGLAEDARIHKSAPHWPGWERDLGLVGAYKRLVGQAFHDAEARGSDLRRKAATGGMFVSSGTLRGLIGDEVREVFAGVLTPLWTEAWNLGYASAKSLVTGEPADFTAKHEGEALQGFLGTEGEHWLDQIARTGLGNNSARSELIARTEVGRAIASAALQCYRDHGVSHKHLLLSPGACDICKDAAEDGDIPLDAPFSSGGVLGLSHPGDRCCPGPSWVDAEPPLARLGGSVKAAATEDESRVAWLLIRARDEDGKWRYLLQQRDDGTWGMPGGTCHAGELGLDAGYRETVEEIGDLPALKPVADLRHVDPDGVQVYLYLCEAPFFRPKLNGTTPEETRAVGWFRRKEVGALGLTPKFRDDWDHIIADCLDGLKNGIGKSLQRTVNETGEVSELTEASQPLSAVGSRWPYPHRSDGTEWPDAGPGAVPGASAGGEPPHWNDDMAEPVPHDTLEPRGGDDGQMPSRGRKPNPPAGAFPDQGSEHDEAWPEPQNTLTPAASSVGARTGVPPSGEKSANDSGHPVVGAYQPSAPKPVQPGSVPPVTFDPATAVEDWNPEADSDVVHDVGKGAQHVTDANPVEWRHVYAQLEGNFPDSALEWVKHSTWAGPLNVPWSRIDADDIDSWAASHQPEAVSRFAREIARGGAHTNPSILFHQASHSDGREKIADGHHRAMARHFKLGKPVLAYVGTVPARWMKQARETHSSQLHQGSDPANKGDAETLREYWAREAHGGPTNFAYADQIKWGTPGDFNRCTSLLMEHGHMTEDQAHGYCNLEHHRALGYWPAQHAQMENHHDERP
jgi:8-oxo-dGTP pyrophosphatase MutT (NUDIX family)